MREIILHLGAPKAGSTFLQRAMLQNHARFATAGIAYPGGGGAHPGNAGEIAALDPDRFAALFAAAPRVVLSHEDLFALAPRGRALAQLARAQGVTVRLVCFLRPWSAFCFGDVSQHLKQHVERYIATRNPFDGLTVEDMAARRAASVDAATFLLRWVRLFPDAPLTLASHAAIPATMERLLGHPGLDWQVPRHLTNPSLRIADCEAIAALIRDGSPAAEVQSALREAHYRTDAPDPGRTPERIARIEALFAKHNRRLLDIWGFDNRLPADQTRPRIAASHRPASCATV